MHEKHIDRPALSSTNEVITMLKELNKTHKNNNNNNTRTKSNHWGLHGLARIETFFKILCLSWFIFLFTQRNCKQRREWWTGNAKKISLKFSVMNLDLYEPRQANLCLRAFRHDKFQLRMPSHSEGPGIWLSVWRFLLIHCLYERAAKVLARLRGCAGSPEPSLLA